MALSLNLNGDKLYKLQIQNLSLMSQTAYLAQQCESFGWQLYLSGSLLCRKNYPTVQNDGCLSVANDQNNLMFA